MGQSVRFGAFKGMDNIHQDIELPHDVLRRAVNADVMDSGRLRRRKGSSQSLAIAGAHSLGGDGSRAYFIAANQMREFSPNGTSTVIGAFAAADNRAAYAPVNNDMYVTCKTASGRIRNGVLTPWGVEVPTAPPVLAASVGVLAAGEYYAAVTYVFADGRESGASALAKITLVATGGITTLAMPNPADANVTKKRLYISTTDGEVLFMAAEIAAADQFVTCGVFPAGARLRTAHLSPPPKGCALAQYNGKIFIVDAADPRVLWFTENLDYDHVDTRKNYYQFGVDISVIAAVTDGLYVCADQTYFLPNAGSPDAGQRVVLGFGAVAGSATQIPNSANMIWMTEHGPAIGKDGGAIELIAENSIASGDMINAAGMVREKDGIRQFVVVGNNTQESALQAGSYAEAEIVRRAG